MKSNPKGFNPVTTVKEEHDIELENDLSQKSHGFTSSSNGLPHIDEMAHHESNNGSETISAFSQVVKIELDSGLDLKGQGTNLTSWTSVTKQATEAGGFILPDGWVEEPGMDVEEGLPNNEKTLQCLQCGKAFARSTSLRVHQKRYHTGQRPCGCSQCGKTFVTPSDLRRHEVIHSGDKPFSCAHCGKTFSLESNLKQHESIHTGEKPFSCLQCGKSFTRASTLKRHELAHTESCHSNVTMLTEVIKEEPDIKINS